MSNTCDVVLWKRAGGNILLTTSNKDPRRFTCKARVPPPPAHWFPVHISALWPPDRDSLEC